VAGHPLPTRTRTSDLFIYYGLIDLLDVAGIGGLILASVVLAVVGVGFFDIRP
jgi:hypothetical protein